MDNLSICTWTWINGSQMVLNIVSASGLIFGITFYLITSFTDYARITRGSKFSSKSHITLAAHHHPLLTPMNQYCAFHKLSNFLLNTTRLFHLVYSPLHDFVILTLQKSLEIYVMARSNFPIVINLQCMFFFSCQATFAYIPRDEDELELSPGDIVYVTETFDDGWYVGISQRTNTYGTFPGNFVQRLHLRHMDPYTL